MLLFYPEFFRPLQFKVIELASVPLRVLAFPLKETKKILYYHRTFDEYRRLANEVNVLKARLVGMDEILRENSRLEALLKFKRKLLYSSVAASVVGRDPSAWNAVMIIDKGTEDGLKQGMSVVSDLGVIGKIAEVNRKKAKVMLLTDPQFSVAALVQGPRESGLVSGTLQGVCRMRYLEIGAEIQVGDKVVTSKLSSSFPESLLIGEVIAIEENPSDGSVQGLIQPSVALSQVEEVLVIVK